MQYVYLTFIHFESTAFGWSGILGFDDWLRLEGWGFRLRGFLGSVKVRGREEVWGGSQILKLDSGHTVGNFRAPRPLVAFLFL